MVYCSNCGKELPENTNFCPKCGIATRKGGTVGVAGPWEDLREAIAEIGEEMEKTFSIAKKEMETAFQKARNEISKATNQKPVVCSQCGETNRTNANFCYTCGTKL
jgi:predicted amidophosphoribosyltransferase